ncbi:LPXTG cell wall anchor domain-containing protein [Enterococcus gallinarum]|uniref:LPXTG cell wall anchor domain-containing protein n=1 Tax=Enterococcus gallinarum TaxID=1353 RepID=UPI00214CA5EF|nr:LPXTG cell wall anchor domain-containing protein [Enterococcus gallinarum]MCR1931132.1 LPXTG cell wall anchor domain-containing protein [Enterococcus gallinarum]
MKKIIIGSMLGWLFLFSATTLAAEIGAYDSNGVTSFYGVYEYPAENSEPPVKVPGNQQFDHRGNQILPATGSDYYSTIQLTGGACLLAALVILSKRSIRNEKDFINSGYRPH